MTDAAGVLVLAGWMPQPSTKLDAPHRAPSVAATGLGRWPSRRLCASRTDARASSRHLPLLSCIGGGHLAKLRA